MSDLTAKDVTGISTLPHRRFCLGVVTNLPHPGDQHPCSDNMVALRFGDSEIDKDGTLTITVHYEHRLAVDAEELLGGLDK